MDTMLLALLLPFKTGSPGAYDTPQTIVVGSGINSLVCAALLAVRGKSVLVIERNSVLGGCIRTEELFPGFTHDILSSWYPLFVGSEAYAELKGPLSVQGLEFVQGDYTTGIVTPAGESLAFRTGMDDALRRIAGRCGADSVRFEDAVSRMFGQDAALTFGLLGKSPYGMGVLRLLFNEWRRRGVHGLLGYAEDSLENLRRWMYRTIQDDLVRAAIAPWVLHGGIGPDDASSAMIGKLTFASVLQGGMPVVKGGSANLVKALRQVVEAHGGNLLSGMEVEQVVVNGVGRKRRATGVIAGGRRFDALEAVVCNVGPRQLYKRLLPDVPESVETRAQAFQYGRAGMQIHFALDRPPSWINPELQHVPLVHLTESMEQVCLSVTEANNGYLPAKPTLAIGQPTAVDATRAPAGKWILWIQMQELPSRIRGDAAGIIATPADGKWTPAIRESMADRVQARLEGVMPGLGETVIGRRAYSPADLEGLNCNLVGGDPYGGVCSPDQFFWLRPFGGEKRSQGHRTPIRNVFHIGASTHPGPGLGAGSGTMVANLLSAG